MFSGIVRYRGTVVSNKFRSDGGTRLVVNCEGVEAEHPTPGDSIAIDGICLTATAVAASAVAFDVIPETLACSTTGDLRTGDAVNVEYALRVGDRLGGHFVYGHADVAAEVLSRTPEGQGERIRIELPDALARSIVAKAFVAVDGISLTVAATGEGWFEIALIPETLARTTLAARPRGSRVNLEVDPIARYHGTL
ncbi:MAG TPA: riboflavin synthase [Candidatus Cybelea sp.]|jgi:riboflavin synthase|nr:riboflavin synthase [Candidatus Cybelea sp.]